MKQVLSTVFFIALSLLSIGQDKVKQSAHEFWKKERAQLVENSFLEFRIGYSFGLNRIIRNEKNSLSQSCGHCTRQSQHTTISSPYFSGASFSVALNFRRIHFISEVAIDQYNISSTFFYRTNRHHPKVPYGYINEFYTQTYNFDAQHRRARLSFALGGNILKKTFFMNITPYFKFSYLTTNRTVIYKNVTFKTGYYMWHGNMTTPVESSLYEDGSPIEINRSNIELTLGGNLSFKPFKGLTINCDFGWSFFKTDYLKTPSNIYRNKTIFRGNIGIGYQIFPKERK